LKYLEGLSPNNTLDDDVHGDISPRNLPLPWSPPSPVPKSPVIHSPTPRGSKNTGSGQLDELAHSRVSYDDDDHDDDGAESNIQDGQRSELGSLHHIDVSVVRL
jgi:hypothetical protein